MKLYNIVSVIKIKLVGRSCRLKDLPSLKEKKIPMLIHIHSVTFTSHRIIISEQHRFVIKSCINCEQAKNSCTTTEICFFFSLGCGAWFCIFINTTLRCTIINDNITTTCLVPLMPPQRDIDRCSMRVLWVTARGLWSISSSIPFSIIMASQMMALQVW